MKKYRIIVFFAVMTLCACSTNRSSEGEETFPNMLPPMVFWDGQEYILRYEELGKPSRTRQDGQFLGKIDFCCEEGRWPEKHAETNYPGYIGTEVYLEGEKLMLIKHDEIYGDKLFSFEPTAKKTGNETSKALTE